MLLLALDTSGKTGSTAALDGGRVLASASFTVGLRHGREIMLRVLETLKQAGKELRDVEQIAVGTGPGSYTGIRVGVTTAKTLAWALGAKLYGVPCADALAMNASLDFDRVCVAIDAKRGEVFGAVYERKGGALAAVCGCEVMKPSKLAELAATPSRKSGEKICVCVLGDAAEPYRGLFEKSGAEALSEEFSSVKAENIGRLAPALPPEADPFKLAPIYLRKSAAEEKCSKTPI
jgi:tRNA threonylcarbamoyladenosine biosynthesis protein TsaB